VAHSQEPRRAKFADQMSGFVAVLSTGVMGRLHSVKVREALTLRSGGGLLVFARFRTSGRWSKTVFYL
jgi:hypothetical protein